MRIVLNLNDQLVRRAKKAAAERGTTLGGLIEDALREELSKPALPRCKRRVLRTFKGDGLRPGVELDGTATLLDLLRLRFRHPLA